MWLELLLEMCSCSTKERTSLVIEAEEEGEAEEEVGTADTQYTVIFH